MALFSPSLMAQFSSLDIPLHRMDKGTTNPETVFNLRMSPVQWFNFARELRGDSSPGASRFLEYSGSTLDSWCGGRNESIPAIMQSGLIESAVYNFKKAKAKLGSKLTRAAPVFSPVGSSFSVARVMMGHPKAALYRPKAKLPPKRIEVSMRASASVSAETLSISIAKIARAIWEYKVSGGQAELIINFVHAFAKAQEWNGKRHTALVNTVVLTPTNLGAFASVASVQFYRGLSMPLAQALSGMQSQDNIPRSKWDSPTMPMLSGDIPGESAILRAFAIES